MRAQPLCSEQQLPQNQLKLHSLSIAALLAFLSVTAGNSEKAQKPTVHYFLRSK